MRSVVVATREIPARTIIKPEMVTVVDRAQDSVDSDASTSTSAVVGQIAFIDIPSGATVSGSKIGRPELGGLTTQVPVGQRAVSIALDPVKGVADLVQPGDHVDVIAVTQPRGTNEAPRVATILRNKVVLAMGTTMEQTGSSAADAANAASSAGTQNTIQTATLAVLPGEAKTLALADLNATLRLSLRSQHDLGGNGPADAFVLDAPAPVEEHVAAAPAAPAVVAPKPVRHGIPLIDGDRFVQ
jgi:pilus assembly protein CpaB